MPTIYYVAATADGFIAGPNDELDWLPPLEDPRFAGEYETFFAGVDALVLGYNTYRVVAAMGDWPYAGKPTLVLSSKPAPAGLPEGMVWSADIQQAFTFKEKYGTVWLIGGGVLAAELVRLGWLERLELTTLPAVLGQGLPLFGPNPPAIEAKLVNARHLGDGAVASTYAVGLKG